MKTLNFNKVKRLTGKAVADYRMITEGDRIMVGLSGGKDSMMLVHVLEALRRRAPVNFEIEIVTFDPGFDGFEADEIAEYCKLQGWSHHTVAAPMESIIREKKAENRPCLLCSRLRRGLLYKKADELKCGKVALGHNLDDIAVSLLISMFRGGGITTMSPNVPADEADLRIIRPLAYAPEDLVSAAAAELELPVFGECAYKELLDEHGDRAYFMKLLTKINKKIPNVRQHVLHSMQDVRPAYLLDLKFLNLSG